MFLFAPYVLDFQMKCTGFQFEILKKIAKLHTKIRARERALE